MSGHLSESEATALANCRLRTSATLVKNGNGWKWIQPTNAARGAHDRALLVDLIDVLLFELSKSDPSWARYLPPELARQFDPSFDGPFGALRGPSQR